MNYCQQKIIKTLLEYKLYYFTAVFLTIAIAIGSLISINDVIETPVLQFFDKFVHTSAYFFLTLSWLLAYKRNLQKQKKDILVVILVFVYGIIIEVLQGVLTNYRQADLLDMLANLGGIVIAALFFNLIFRRK